MRMMMTMRIKQMPLWWKHASLLFPWVFEAAIALGVRQTKSGKGPARTRRYRTAQPLLRLVLLLLARTSGVVPSWVLLLKRPNSASAAAWIISNRCHFYRPRHPSILETTTATRRRNFDDTLGRTIQAPSHPILDRLELPAVILSATTSVTATTATNVVLLPGVNETTTVSVSSSSSATASASPSFTATALPPRRPKSATSVIPETMISTATTICKDRTSVSASSSYPGPSFSREDCNAWLAQGRRATVEWDALLSSMIFRVNDDDDNNAKSSFKANQQQQNSYYHCWLDTLALAAAATPNNNFYATEYGERALDILHRMESIDCQYNKQQTYQNNNSPSSATTVNVVVYNKVLKVWKNIATASVSNKTVVETCVWQAHAILERMMKNSSSTTSVPNTATTATTTNPKEINSPPVVAANAMLMMTAMPDAISYTSYMAILAAHGTVASAQQANDMANAMLRLSKQQVQQQAQRENSSPHIGIMPCFSGTSSGIKPTSQTWNTVLSAWVKCGRLDRAETVLQQMEAFDDMEMAPNVVSYSTLLDGWAKQQQTLLSSLPSSSDDLGALGRMEQVFFRMKDLYETGQNTATRPNFYTYVTLIHAYARQRDAKYTQKAQDLVFLMYDKYTMARKGEGCLENLDLKPNTQLVAAVMEAWQKSGVTMGASKAQSLLDWTIAVSQNDNDTNDHDKDLAPNEYSFSCTYHRVLTLLHCRY